MKKIISYFYILSLFTFTFLGTSQLTMAQEREYTETDTSISVSVGETFSIKVVSNRTTGYSWSVGEISDGAQVVVLGSQYVAPEGGVPGQGGYETWKFKALASGNVKLIWNYIRQWEKNESPSKTLTFNVSVK